MRQQRIDKYIVESNTDFGRVEFTTYEEAEKAWENVAPRDGAGNKYYAAFRGHCATCDGYQDMNSEGVTCECGQ